MCDEGADFFDKFQAVCASNTKRFNFKQVVAKKQLTETSLSGATKSEVRPTSQKENIIHANKEINKAPSETSNSNTSSSKSKFKLQTVQSKLNFKPTKDAEYNSHKAEAATSLNKLSSTEKDSFDDFLGLPSTSKPTVQNNVEKKATEIRAKTFMLKKSCINKGAEKKCPAKERSEITAKVDFNIDKTVNISKSSEKLQLAHNTSNELIASSDRKIKSSKFTFKKEISSTSLDIQKNNISKSEGSSVVEISDSPFSQKQKHASNIPVDPPKFNFEEDDYMDDETFASFLAADMDLEKSQTVKPADVNIDLGDIDWSEDFSLPNTSTANTNSNLHETTSSTFNNRRDDSEEFRKNYPHSDVMNEVLHQKFGLRHFRPHQKEIINASLTQHDCFVLMPTGGGKSLCYQLPAILMPGVTIVISPLRALISDQVDKLNALDIPSAHLCADVKKAEVDVIFEKLHMREPIIKLLYLTPEKIVASGKVTDMISSLYKRDKLARFVIDEVHCLSQWGHDFRPDYKQLSTLRRNYPTVPIICLTATATKQVQGDVTSILSLKNVKTFIRSFNRPNIKYKVIQKTGKKTVDEIATIIKQKFYRKSGIIYCLCRADCETLAQNLCRLGIKAKAYHAGMGDSVREKQQREWMQDQFHVIVATIAFGMGIDKPDVRFVIHNSVPKSVEAFYQESGRAGRDGEPSYSYLFYSYGDVGRLKRLMKFDKKSVKKALAGHFDNLNQMVSFCENTVDCRRYLQLIHLGEKFDRKVCIDNKDTICDNCENISKNTLKDVTKEARELGQLARDLSSKDNITMINIAEIYKGCKLKKILDKGHDKHKFYGNGSGLDRVDIQRILIDLILRKILEDYCAQTGEFPVVYIKTGPKYNNLHQSDLKVQLSIGPTKAAPVAKTTKAQPQTDEADNGIDLGNPEPSTSAGTSRSVNKYTICALKVQCHEELLEECRRLAVEKNVTLSSIMNLSAIKNMSEVMPNTREEFMNIQHVTRANYEKFGEYFLKITQKYREQLDKMKTPVQSFSDSSVFDDSDWCEENLSQSSTGSKKRKSTGGYKKNAKRFKKTHYRKGKGKKKSAGKAKKSSPKGKKTSKSSGGSLGLMPLRKL